MAPLNQTKLVGSNIPKYQLRHHAEESWVDNINRFVTTLGSTTKLPETPAITRNSKKKKHIRRNLQLHFTHEKPISKVTNFLETSPATSDSFGQYHLVLEPDAANTPKHQALKRRGTIMGGSAVKQWRGYPQTPKPMLSMPKSTSKHYQTNPPNILNHTPLHPHKRYRASRQYCLPYRQPIQGNNTSIVFRIPASLSQQRYHSVAPHYSPPQYNINHILCPCP